MTSWMLRDPDHVYDKQRPNLKQVCSACPHLGDTAGHVSALAEILTDSAAPGRMDGGGRGRRARRLHRFVGGLRRY
jgi:hypothetical protein